jgi:5-hmdU DNA kinase, helical domain
MRHAPLPRRRIYDLYWYFASQRQRIFERRVAGTPPPWTDDPILQAFKFCNVYRAADRVSQHLIRDVCYHQEPCQPEDRLFQIVAFRTFSRVQTWRSVRGSLGRHPTIDDLANGSFAQALEHAKQANGRLYTGAFILCANNAYRQPSKHRNHVELFRHMFCQDNLGARLLTAGSLREVYTLLRGYPLMGEFMAYQTAIDLNYSSLINFSENAFTQPGPGALRGIRKAFEHLGGYSPAELIGWMVDRQEEEFARLGLPFTGLWGRPLHAIDCQGLFCELDKYCRVAAPELASSRTRIKARFTAAPDPIRLLFPPKWGVNDQLPGRPVFGSPSPTEPQPRLF